ncbi:hypothetical protein [Companilactobacillus versmoldensis]|uniref:Uncharacterized protein n=1 Tax=Companilactobacillus versmoldensis DSM 14857 = KCTC 3814 TaxID=1423815 RepID=A0A0R1SDN2_9LACO|nr:hypothetical protein [Companilactobacillus versmoldensis]KRL66777.1 hypothetical protein FC27_GL000382 [Companilactobacillus versmoldensis DSM 14857 = KCTC 3814]
MDQTRVKNLIKSLIELISFHIFAVGFVLTHHLPSTAINYYLLVLIAMIALYKEFMLPLKPNQFFSGFYSLIFILIAAFGYKSMNPYVSILIFAQLFFLFVTKYIPQKYNLASIVIKDFVVPCFVSIAILFYYAHFISIHFVVPLLLVNIIAIMITYFDGEMNSYIQIIVTAVATLILFLLGYLNIFSTIAVIAFTLITVLLKIFNKFATNNVVYRFIGNILLII